MYSYIADNQEHHPVLNDPSLVSFPEKFACSHRICVFFFLWDCACSMCQMKWALSTAYRCDLFFSDGIFHSFLASEARGMYHSPRGIRGSADITICFGKIITMNDNN